MIVRGVTARLYSVVVIAGGVSVIAYWVTGSKAAELVGAGCAIVVGIVAAVGLVAQAMVRPGRR